MVVPVINRGIAIGLKRGHPVKKRVAKKTEPHGISRRIKLVKEIVRELSGFSPYERRVLELLKNGLDKRALKVAKKRLGHVTTAKKKREALAAALRKARTAAH